MENVKFLSFEWKFFTCRSTVSSAHVYIENVIINYATLILEKSEEICEQWKYLFPSSFPQVFPLSQSIKGKQIFYRQYRHSVAIRLFIFVFPWNLWKLFAVIVDGWWQSNSNRRDRLDRITENLAKWARECFWRKFSFFCFRFSFSSLSHEFVSWILFSSCLLFVYHFCTTLRVTDIFFESNFKHASVPRQCCWC